MALVGSLLVNLGLKSAAFEKGMNRSTKKISAFDRRVLKTADSLGRMSKRMLLIGGAAAAAFMRFASKQEDAEMKLDSALNRTGASIEKHSKRLKNLAADIQKVTVYGDEFTMVLMAQGINLGISADKIGLVTEQAIGLATALDMDLKTAMRYMAIAAQGEFTVLQRYIPELRKVTEEREKAAIVNRMAAAGYKQAQDIAKTTSGQLAQLGNRFGDIAERIGKLLLPTLERLVKVLERVATRMEALDDKQVQSGVSIFGWSMATLAATYAGSKLVKGVIKMKQAFGWLGPVIAKAAKGTGKLGALVMLLGGGLGWVARLAFTAGKAIGVAFVAHPVALAVVAIGALVVKLGLVIRKAIIIRREFRKISKSSQSLSAQSRRVGEAQRAVAMATGRRQKIAAMRRLATARRAAAVGLRAVAGEQTSPALREGYLRQATRITEQAGDVQLQIEMLEIEKASLNSLMRIETKLGLQ